MSEAATLEEFRQAPKYDIVAEVDMASPSGPKKYDLKQAFGRIRSFDDLELDYVFYVPIVQTLLNRSIKSFLTTDIFSATLSAELGEHPLVITGLTKKVFRISPVLLVDDEVRAMENALYVCPSFLWTKMEQHFCQASAIDRITHRFCIFHVKKFTVPCPLSKFPDKTLDIWFCDLYGNREHYYFSQEPEGIVMNVTAPYQEFVELGDMILAKANGVKIEDFAAHFRDNFSIETQRYKTIGEEKKREAGSIKGLEVNDEMRKEYEAILKSYKSQYGIR
jgi:hypothetical protein